MPTPDHDLVIIGGGPAGLTAGLYAARAKLNVILIEKMAPGGQVLITDWVENYPGFPEGISGFDLIRKMTDQAKKFGLPIESGEVESIDTSDTVKTIKTDGGSISARSVIIASGASPKKLGIPGEDVFYGKGVSSCATCDGPFFKDRVVAAVGGGDTAVQESLYLTKFAKKVYLIHRRDQLRATGILRDRALENEKIEILWDSALTGISGLTNVEKIAVKNLKSDEIRNLDVAGCFIWIGILPNGGFFPETVKCDEYGFIVTDMEMKTSVPGIFAAGDVRSTSLRQIVTAVGDAATAAFSAEHYIEKIRA